MASNLPSSSYILVNETHQSYLHDIRKPMKKNKTKEINKIMNSLLKGARKEILEILEKIGHIENSKRRLFIIKSKYTNNQNKCKLTKLTH